MEYALTRLCIDCVKIVAMLNRLAHITLTARHFDYCSDKDESERTGCKFYAATMLRCRVFVTFSLKSRFVGNQFSVLWLFTRQRKARIFVYKIDASAM